MVVPYTINAGGDAADNVLDFQRDAGWQHVTKTVTFTGAAGLGAIGEVPVFNITGRVLVDVVVGFCTTDLVGAGTVALGCTTFAGVFIAATTGTDLDINEWWTDASPAVGIQGIKANLDSDTVGNRLKALSEHIVIDVAGADITAGVIMIDVWFKPVTAGATLVAA